jgi:hypothetical protein
VRRQPPAPERSELVDAGEIARRLDLRHRSVVLEWRLLSRFGFPAPVMRRRTYLWRWADVEAWSRAHAHEVVTHRSPPKRRRG